MQRSGVPARTGSGMTRGRRGGGRRSKVVVVEDAGRLDPRDGRRGLQDPAEGMAMDDGEVGRGQRRSWSQRTGSGDVRLLDEGARQGPMQVVTTT